MSTYQVRFTKENKTIAIPEGTTLLAAAISAGLRPDAPCGGRGKCGKCRVKCHKEGEDWQEVLACETPVSGDIWVETEAEEEPLHVLLEGSGRKISFDPRVKRKTVFLLPRSEQPGLSEWERLSAAADIQFQADLPLVRKLAQYDTKDGLALQLVYREDKALDLYPVEEEHRLLGAAVDIGTTSIACYLLDLQKGTVLTTASTINPQFSYGADVIGRANYALEQGEEPLTACIREKVNELLGQMCEKAAVVCRDVYSICLVGNSCMHHLYLGISPWSMVHAPYQPAVNTGMCLSAKEYGLQAAETAELVWLPLIAGFVGADTVACLLSTELAWQDELSLMIDIGTNGELVMGNRERRLSCSTAAGPALEGAKIACGMRGTKGAIEHVDIVDGEVRIQVIGGGQAVGICGSGLIDAIAVLCRLGIIDESGHMESEDTLENQPVYWLAPPREGYDGVYLSQRDIREVQLAKGAIAAGITLLAEQLGITLAQVEKVYLAGAFGTYLRPENACRIGLIPQELSGRILAVGNSAGEGAKQVLLSADSFAQAERLARETDFLELASLAEFQDTFVDELEFPEGE